MTKQEVILSAIRRANKLGAKGIEVVGYLEPQSATELPELRLIAQMPKETTASEMAWYDR